MGFVRRETREHHSFLLINVDLFQVKYRAFQAREGASENSVATPTVAWPGGGVWRSSFIYDKMPVGFVREREL